MRSFWFHFNRPASQRAGHPVMSVHHKGSCLLVRHIVCHAPVETRTRKTQPRVVMAGIGYVRVDGDTAYITQS